MKRTLLERIAYGTLLLAVLVLGFFFLAAALVAGAILAAAIGARIWWLQRKLRKASEEEFIKAEYSVVEREQPPAPRLPPEP
ncbi:MAG: hypothetical protein HYY78_16180 [Betaproteobacteria bacterium]|nr:hypothetical protein [Betaproteobacteria bacterium]